jgi:hypothetical protein
MSLPIVIDGNTVDLKFTTKALIDLERISKRQVMSFLTDDPTKLSIVDASMIFWAGLRHQDPKLTIEKAETLFCQYAESVGLLVAYNAIAVEFFNSIAGNGEKADQANPQTAVETA